MKEKKKVTKHIWRSGMWFMSEFKELDAKNQIKQIIFFE